jgi:hypothetical protein
MKSRKLHTAFEDTPSQDLLIIAIIDVIAVIMVTIRDLSPQIIKFPRRPAPFPEWGPMFPWERFAVVTAGKGN